MSEESDLLLAFSEDAKGMFPKVQTIAASLKENSNQPQLYDEFKAVADAVYAASAALGFKELEEYSSSVKKLCAMCGKSYKQEPGTYAAVWDIVKVYATNFGRVLESAHDPKLFRSMRSAFIMETVKAEQIYARIKN